jgi:hypothetical protein
VPRVDTEFYLIRRRFDVQPVKDDTIGEDIFPKIKNNIKMSSFFYKTYMISTDGVPAVM